jgi:hypothetical protein
MGFLIDRPGSNHRNPPCVTKFISFVD